MSASTHRLKFPGAMTERGFWLYVWRITSDKGQELLYVGRTGDSGSPRASSPFTRMGQHLGTNEKNNAIRRHLENKGVKPEACAFEMVAHGPLFPEAKDRTEHVKPRDVVAALEKELAETLLRGGYKVLNNVKSKKALDTDLWDEVCAAFAVHFPKLGRASGQ